MRNIERFVQISRGPCAYLSVAWSPFREKMEERYHHHNQLKKLTHMGTKTKETPMHYQAAAAQCTVSPPLPHCVLKWGFTWTFPGNQDATLKYRISSYIFRRCWGMSIFLTSPELARFLPTCNGIWQKVTKNVSGWNLQSILIVQGVSYWYDLK